MLIIKAYYYFFFGFIRALAVLGELLRWLQQPALPRLVKKAVGVRRLWLLTRLRDHSLQHS